MLALGKKPKIGREVMDEETIHYRQALIEAADAFDKLTERDGGWDESSEEYKIIKKMRISAGVKL